MDRFESRMTPRFLVESEKGMLLEPRVIESGRETVEGLKGEENGNSFSFVTVKSELMLGAQLLHWSKAEKNKRKNWTKKQLHSQQIWDHYRVSAMDCDILPCYWN